jgi:ribonuclease BN (tRNA processing enzyme)
MRVIFVGTGCGVPSPKRASPSLIIEVGSEILLFDPGPGSLWKMTDLGFRANDIDSIFFTHLHVDHTADLPAILFASKYPLDQRRKDLRLFGPKGFGGFYRNLLSLYGEQIISQYYQVEVKEMGEGVLRFDGWCVRSALLSHTPNAIGYRIQTNDGKVVVYSGDTGYCDGIIQLSEGADLLILESSFPDGMGVEGHLTPSLAGKVGNRAGCKRLVLTHLYPVYKGVDAVKGCKAFYRGDVVLAEDGMEIEV